MGLLEKTNKRRFYPVPLSDRTVHLRSMTLAESARRDAQPDGKVKGGLLVGFCLVDEDGAQEIPQEPKETDPDYAARVMQELADADVDLETFGEIVTAVNKISFGDFRKLAKN